MKETTEQEIVEQLLKPYNYGAFFTDQAQTAVWLYATFNIHLPEALLVEGEPGEPISIGVNLEEFDAEVQLTLNPKLGRVRKSNEGRWYYAMNEMSVTISRHADLPEDIENHDDYFGDELLPEYQQAAIDAANRLATFLRYRLWSSLFSAIERFKEDYGEDGRGKGAIDLSQQARFDIQYSEDGQLGPMQDYIAENFSDELADLFLIQAQQSILSKQSRRACLELTMACESFVKRRIPSAHMLADAIDDGFKSRHQAAYIDLRGLFQARDEAAQQTQGFFSVNSQTKREETHDNLMVWGASVTCLKQWLAEN